MHLIEKYYFKVVHIYYSHEGVDAFTIAKNDEVRKVNTTKGIFKEVFYENNIEEEL